MKKRGNTLIEVIVSIFIFTMSMVMIFTGATFTMQSSQKREATMQFVSVCYDINEYSNVYGKDWADKYFESDVIHGSDDFYVYYDSDFRPCKNEGAYKLVYSYGDGGNLTVSVVYSRGDKVILSDVDFGGNRYA